MANFIPNSYDHSGIDDKGILASPSIIYNGRVETYSHSDDTTPNKGSCIVRIDCDTEFGAKTQEFMNFCKHTAMLCYGAQSEIWEDVIKMFPDLEKERLDLESILKEKVTIIRIVIVTLIKDVWQKDNSLLADYVKMPQAKRFIPPLFDIPKNIVQPNMPIVDELRYKPIKPL
jgi:hypothetical protein